MIYSRFTVLALALGALALAFGWTALPASTLRLGAVLWLALVLIVRFLESGGGVAASSADLDAPDAPDDQDDPASDPSDPAVDAQARSDARLSIFTSVGLWLLALPVVYGLYRISAGATRPEGFLRHAILDKRWLIGLYWATVTAVAWCPPVFYGLLRQWRRRGAARSSESSASPSDKARLGPRHAVKLLIAFAFATLAFGPPWNLQWSSRAINPHEAVHWGGLQAIDHGETPYVGPASVNYGPGSQLTMYAYLDARDAMTVPGTRETFALALWLAVFLFAAVALLALPPWPASAAILMMLIVSPVAGWSWSPAGILNGFFGWANVLRNISTLLLSAGIVAMVRLGPAGRPSRAAAWAVGLLWGALAYYAQENLFGGVLVMALLLGLALGGGLLSVAGVLAAAVRVAAGFVLVWTPVVGYYLSKGALGEFLHNYFLVPGRFLRGYGNTPYRGTLEADPLALPFYVTAGLALLLAVSVAFERRPLRPAYPLSPDRFLVLALTLAFLAAYPSGLLRADGLHFQSTTFALPILMAIALFRSARWRGGIGGPALGVALVALVIGLTYLPSWRAAPERLMALAKGRAASFDARWSELRPPAPPSETARRYGPVLARQPKTQQHIELLTRLGDVVGEDPVLVLVEVPRRDLPAIEYIFEGFVYFMADLRAGPILMERSDMVGTQADVDRFLEHLEARIEDFEWIVSLSPSEPEIDVFRRAFPDATYQTVEADGAAFHVFGRPRPSGLERSTSMKPD